MKNTSFSPECILPIDHASHHTYKYSHHKNHTQHQLLFGKRSLDPFDSSLFLQFQRSMRVLNNVNRRGITYFENGNYREANVCFGQALRLVKRTTATAFASLVGTPVVCIGCCSIVPSKESGNELTQQPRFQGSSFYTIHQVPMQAPASLCRCGCLSCHSKLAFVFVFNLALCNHFLSLREDKSRQNLTKAVTLYEIANELYGHGADFPLSKWEYLALRKNISHAKKLLDYIERSQSAVTLMASSSSDVSEQDAQKLWEAFLSVLFNLCVFRENQIAPAA